MDLRSLAPRLISVFACLVLPGVAGAEDLLKLDGKWMVTTMGSASDHTSAPQTLEPGRYTLEIHGASLVATTQWSAASTADVERDTFVVTSSTPGTTVATVTDAKGATSTWTFSADGTGLTATFPDLRLHLMPFDARAAAQTAQDDQESAPGGPPIQDRPLSGTIAGAPWTAAHGVHDETDDSSTVTCYKLLAVPPPADGALDEVGYLNLEIPNQAGPYPFTVNPVRNCHYHIPPNRTLFTTAVRMVIYSRSERSMVIGVAAHFDHHSTISGRFTIDLPIPPKPREHFTLDGKWIVHSITSTKPGENSMMTPEPGGMTIIISGSSIATTLVMMPDDSDKPEASTLSVTNNVNGKITATVTDQDGSKETWVVTADDQGMTVTSDDQVMRLLPWNEKAVADFNAHRQDALKPARPLTDGVLSGVFDGAPWTAASCIRSSFQMHKDKVECEIAAVPQKPNDLEADVPTIMLALPKKPGTYPFSGSCSATFNTPPGKNAIAIRGQLVIYSVTDKAITFGLSARADKDHDVAGRFACDLTVPVDITSPDAGSDTPKQDK